MNILKGIGILIGVIAVIFVLGFIGNSMDLFNLSFFGPKVQAAQTKIFEETPAYTLSKNQDLAKYHHDWVTDTNKIDQKAIENLVRQQLSVFPPEKVQDPELQAWFRGIINN